MTKGNMNINLEGSILGEVLDADYLILADRVKLNPTNYCAAMWNGVRCDGSHEVTWSPTVRNTGMRDQGYDVFHSARGESGRYHSMWRDGYGGITLDERPYIEELDIDLSWSDLDRIHAEARDSTAKAHMVTRATAYAGQAAGTIVSGLLETFTTFEV